MKGNQENKLSMYYAVQKVCSANSGVWKGLPAFVSAFNVFETNIGKIQNALGVQDSSIKGVSKDKDAIENVMIDKALEVANAIYAYASEINDFTLSSKVDFSRSDLKQIRDSVTLQRCQQVHHEASGISGLLLDYGITAQDLNSLQDSVNLYANVIATTRTAVVERKGATEEIRKLLLKTDMVLKNKLDKLMDQFKVPDPKFYGLFFDARMIIQSGLRHEDGDIDPAGQNAA